MFLICYTDVSCVTLTVGSWFIQSCNTSQSAVFGTLQHFVFLQQRQWPGGWHWGWCQVCAYHWG